MFRNQRTLARLRPGHGRVAALAILSLALAACDPEATPSPNETGTISGQVVGLDGRPVAGATIAPENGDTTRTDSQGRFSLTGVRSADRLAVNVTSDAFVSTTVVFPVEPGRETFRVVSLIPRVQAQRVDAGRGGEVALGRGGSVRLEPGSLVDASGRPVQGEVLVRATYLDPTDTTIVLAAPGDYLSSIRGGAGAPLETFGMVEVNVTDRGGRQLQLAPRRTATVRWPRTSDQGTGVQFVMDRSSGLWSAGDSLIIDRTPIDNFVNINNWDIRFPVVCIKVNAGAQGIRVVAQGVDYSSATDGWSDASGMVLLGVRASSTVKVGVHPFNPAASVTISTPAGPVVPPNTPFLTQPQRQAACRASTLAVAANLNVPPAWVAARRIDAVVAR